MNYSMLSDLWDSSEIKPILTTNDQGINILVQTKAANNWFIGKLMGQQSFGYTMDSTMIAVRGDIAVWRLIDNE